MTQQDTQPPAETLAIIEMLQAAEVQEGVTVFDHSPEEIGMEVMENHHAILAALTRRAGGDAHEWPNPCSVIVPVCPVSKDTARILAMVADGEGSGEIGKAAVLGVDLIWGYADPTIAEQSEQIDRARANIIVAIRAAVAGISLIAGDYSHD